MSQSAQMLQIARMSRAAQTSARSPSQVQYLPGYGSPATNATEVSREPEPAGLGCISNATKPKGALASTTGAAVWTHFGHKLA